MPAALALMLLLAGAPAAAPTGDPDAPICRKEPRTGTRFTKKRCQTKAEWQEIDAAYNAQKDEFGRRMQGSIGADRPLSNSPFPR